MKIMINGKKGNDVAAPENCPDCLAAPGTNHKSRCDIEQCPVCGGQKASCDCDRKGESLPWTGIWPGVAECREWGWFAKLVEGQGWISCSAKDKDAFPDINRLHSDAIWDRSLGRFVRKDEPC